jgi:hypothetical protein
LTFPEPDYNKLNGKGVFVANEKIDGDIFGVLETAQCSLDMKTCQKLNSLRLDDLCKKIADEKAFWYNIFEHITPPLRCPLQPGNYNIPEAGLDLSLFAMVPIDGHVWVTQLKIIADRGKKGKKLLMCFNVEAEVTKVRVRS